jgi:hypothetical protein
MLSFDESRHFIQDEQRRIEAIELFEFEATESDRLPEGAGIGAALPVWTIRSEEYPALGGA